MLRIFIKMTYTIQTQDIINDEKPGVLKEINSSAYLFLLTIGS